jgi:hypothetical protein
MPNPEANMSGQALSTAQVIILVVLGAVLWFLAAIMLRALAPLGIYDGSNRVLFYALVIPGTFPFVLIARRLARLAPDQMAIALAIATAAATLLDGIALAWFPALYGSDPVQIAGAGAAILWGAGVGLVMGIAINRAGRG